MSKKRIMAIVIVLAACILSNGLIFKYIKVDTSANLKFVITVESDKVQTYEVYYDKDADWSAQQCVSAQYKKENTAKDLGFYLPRDAGYLRIDLGNEAGTHFISEMKFAYGGESLALNPALALSAKTNMIESMQMDGKNLVVTTNGEDGYFSIYIGDVDLAPITKVQEKNVIIGNIIRCAAIDILLLAALLFMNKFTALPLEVYRNRQLMLNLAKNDFKTKYAGSYLGIIWAFIQPTVTVLVYWFVFQVGFRSGAVMEYPFVLWLISGLVPWFFFSDALNGGTSSLIEYSYLVKKVVFKISIVPIVKIISALFVHIFFVLFTIFLFTLYGYFPDIYTLQVIYYSACMFILVLAISYATCSVIIFFRDLGQIINIFLQVGIWMTPIMWQETMIGEGYRWILKLNPIYYIVDGYRGALIDKVWFWENPNQLIYFWFVTAVMFAFGAMLFKRLKVHFADVL